MGAKASGGGGGGGGAGAGKLVLQVLETLESAFSCCYRKPLLLPLGQRSIAQVTLMGRGSGQEEERGPAVSLSHALLVQPDKELGGKHTCVGRIPAFTSRNRVQKAGLGAEKHKLNN